MVFRSDPVESPEEVKQRENMIKTAKLGKDVVKVVQRCDEAEETKTLDLSYCSLMKVPEAVTFILNERAYDIRPPTFFTKVGKKFCSPTFH